MKPMYIVSVSVLATLGLAAIAVQPSDESSATTTTLPKATTTTTTIKEFVLKLPAQATKKAVRGPIWQETPIPIMGLNGMPFAPEGLNDCDEMSFYRIQAGLPNRFDSLGWRESNCRNEEGVKTFCCYGYWQIYYSLHANKLATYCSVQSKYDINGDESLDKQRQACSAKVLFDESGYSPWSL